MMSDYWQKARGEKILPIERSLLYGMAEYVGGMFEHDRPTIVNIGVSWGASVHCLHAGAPDARLIAIDIDLETRPVQGVEHLENVEFIEAESGPYGLGFVGRARLVFVDGNHTYNGVKEDIYGWLRHIPLEGIIAFHDYYVLNPGDQKRLKGVKQAVSDWRENVGDDWVLRWSAGSIVVYQRVK